jgi:hypothetical protein
MRTINKKMKGGTMAINKALDIDISSQSSFIKIHIPQGDNIDRKFYINFLDGSNEYIIPATAIVRFQMTKFNGAVIYNNCPVVNNQVEFDITPAISAESGRHSAQFKITDSFTGGELKSFRLHLLIEENVDIESVVVNTSEFTALQDMELRVGDAAAILTLAEEATGNANNAATAANTATSNAITATSDANSSATNANSKASLANAAAGNADSKASLAINAATNANEKADLANTATSNANSATSNANSAATNANAIANQLAVETLKVFKDAVPTYSDLATTYPNPENGWTVTVTGENVSYRYNGTSWINLGYIAVVEMATDTVTGIVKGGGNVKIAINGTMNVPDVGDLTQLQTKSNADLVVAINEVNGKININKNHFINVLNPPNNIGKADSTGTSDNSGNLQSMVDYLLANGGGTLYFPTGTYIINSTVNITYGTNNAVVNIIGDGKWLVNLKKTVSSTSAIFSFNNPVPNNPDLSFVFKGMTLRGTDTTNEYAVILSRVLFSEFSDCFITHFDSGFRCKDVIFLTFNRNLITFCKVGILLGKMDVMSPPNAITISDCVFLDINFYAVYMDGGSQLNIYNGSMERCGDKTQSFSNAPIYIVEPSVNESTCCNISGTYFEFNNGTANIMLVNTDRDTVINITGCSFMNGTSTQTSANTINITGGANNITVLNLKGNSFKTYYPEYAQPYYAQTGNVNLNSMGNFYDIPSLAPNYISQYPIAMAFIGNLTSFTQAYNIKSIENPSVGHLVVNLKQGSFKTIGNYIILPEAGYTIEYPSGNTNKQLLLNFKNSNGDYANPSYVNLLIYA